MTWQDTKRYKQRKREELERVKLLHDLFFKHPISKNRTENSTASKPPSVHRLL